MVGAEALDAWFEAKCTDQYTRQLLFSTLFGLMTQVVLRESPSVHAAYRARVGEIGVSVTSVYNKLNGLSAQIGAGLVRRVADEGVALIEELGAGATPLAGYEVRILDGNTLGARASTGLRRHAVRRRQRCRASCGNCAATATAPPARPGAVAACSPTG